MMKVGLFVRLEAKAGKEAEVKVDVLAVKVPA